MPSFRRVLAVAAAALGIALFTAPPAFAGSESSPYSCLPSNSGGVFIMEIIAPATAARGATVTIEANVTGTVNYDSAVEGGRAGGMTVTVGGVSSGLVEATGATMPRIDPGTPFRLVGGRAQVTLPNAGEVTFRPASFYTVINPASGARHTCWVIPASSAEVVATTRVS